MGWSGMAEKWQDVGHEKKGSCTVPGPQRYLT